MTDVNANLNNTNCIVTKSHFGYDAMINICSGKTTNVDWAFGDWCALTFVIFIGLLLLGMIIGIIYMLATD